MEFRFEKTARAVLTGLILLAPAVLGAQEFRYAVWHPHYRPPGIRKTGAIGTLTISETGVAFEEQYKVGKAPKEPHAWRWSYDDIQQLKIAPRAVTVLTYQDNAWKLGADRQYTFELRGDGKPEDALRILRARLNQRLVAAMPVPGAEMLWELPVKHTARFGGDEGVLRVERDRVVFDSRKPSASRTWRYEDIDNVSSSGPFDLTLTTFERDKLDYGSLRQFHFQLRRRLEEAAYNDLWMRLNRSKGLMILDSYRQ
jgi:hypothetical protein